MSPTQRRRLLLVLLVVAVAGVAAVLVATALQRNIAYLYTPAEV
ncbi:MAG TPA: cytochrome c biogenesis protein CcmE, partial [Stenotrophomonas sp.]|nr:cytochrome c biogenesis protein CcmE [Stenotrophomonas sp.]